MPTLLEKSITQSRRSQGVLRPLLEELFREPVFIQTKEDADWVHALAMKIVEREKVRVEGQGVFSPSGLASCLRRVYLGRHWKQLGLERISLPNVSAHGYFNKGNFVHLQWQFAFYKLQQRNPDFTLIDCEVPIVSKRGDHGGTIDILCAYKNEMFPVDIKGLNVREFNKIVSGNVPADYRIQVCDYTMLLNANLKRTGFNGYPPATRGILLVESKGGPDTKHPLAIHEAEINLRENLPEVRARLEVLREHEAKKEIPKPECTSIKSHQFQSCPFAGFCKEEVRRIEKKRERRAAKSSNTTKLKVARPSRNNRSRGSKAR